jgi:uncharacterized protein (TIGR02231 family)
MLGLMPTQLWAQATPNKISQVQVYPGGALVERSARVAAGTQVVKLSCLPARFEIDSLQVQADAGIQIGDVSVQTLARASLPECAASPLDARILALEDSQAGLKAESEALDLALGYLKGFGGESGRPSSSNGPAGTQAAASIASTTEALKRSGQETLQRQYQLLRRKQELEQQLTPLLAERNRLIQANPQLRTVLIRVAAPREGELRLSYRLTQAGWSPVYRAYLDTLSKPSQPTLRLERHAQVAQTSGEDWSGIKLRLSTAQPSLASKPPVLRPWTLDLLPPQAPQPPRPASAMAYAPPPPAPSPVFAASAAPEARVSFDVSVFQGEYATEFEVPGRVDVSSDGQRVAFALGSQMLEPQVLVRVQPQLEAQAYLLADSARPAGSWPNGNLQLFRDGAFVGQSYLALGNEERLELFFGRDEMLRVLVEPEQRDGANAGFIGSRIEQKTARAYVLENLHKLPVTVQVLEAAPLARHEDIKVQTVFNPKPTQQAWQKQPGVVAWQLPLAPAQTLRITADYLISYPKDARIGGLH